MLIFSNKGGRKLVGGFELTDYVPSFAPDDQIFTLTSLTGEECTTPYSRSNRLHLHSISALNEMTLKEARPQGRRTTFFVI